MSLLGKILLVVNLLAAAGLAYLTAQSWAKRQEINGAAIQFELALAGLPVEEPKQAAEGDSVPLKVLLPGGFETDTVTKKLLDKYFSGAGTAVNSQLKEVKDALQKIEANVAAKGTDAEKLRDLCGGITADGGYAPGVLNRYADTFEEREAIRNLGLTRDPAAVANNLAQARARLQKKFDAALNPPAPNLAQADAAKLEELKPRLADAAAADELRAIYAAGGPGYARDESDRRSRIAQVLMLTDFSADAQKRVALIVGLRTYVKALNELTSRQEECTRRLERSFEIDQARFQDEYELLKRLAVEQDKLLFQQQRVVAGLKEQLASDNDSVNARQTQLQALEKDLGVVVADVAKLLQEQAAVEGALFNVQKKVGETLRGNFDLEAKLLSAEKGKK
jgi:hypothetical protein